jgi:hypothetical protein
LSQPRDQSDEQYIIDILCCEYGRVVVERLGHGTISRPERRKVTRREHKIRGAADARSLETLRRSEWPTPVSKEVVLDCLHRYYEGSKWIDPPVCAVCSQRQRESRTVVISANPESPPSDISLEVLRLTDPFIIRKCIVQRISVSFTFNNSFLDGAMLDKAGITATDEQDSDVGLDMEE